MDKKILIIEDDKDLLKYMNEYITAYGYVVEVVEDLNNIEEQIYDSKCDLILLDINLPRLDGFYYLKVIKNKINTPIIIVSARSEEGEQIRGMELGADDYITKPFSMGILLAKISAVIRRVNNVKSNVINVKGSELICDGMELKCGEEIFSLSKNEFKLMKIFMTNYKKVVTREELLEELWDEDEFVDDNTLTVNITRLKKRLSEDKIDFTIKTKRGIGYVLI